MAVSIQRSLSPDRHQDSSYQTHLRATIQHRSLPPRPLFPTYYLSPLPQRLQRCLHSWRLPCLTYLCPVKQQHRHLPGRLLGTALYRHKPKLDVWSMFTDHMGLLRSDLNNKFSRARKLLAVRAILTALQSSLVGTHLFSLQKRRNPLLPYLRRERVIQHISPFNRLRRKRFPSSNKSHRPTRFLPIGGRRRPLRFHNRLSFSRISLPLRGRLLPTLCPARKSSAIRFQGKL